ncbi:hypothetical protein DF040_14330 [Burkholderia cenocepacia]|nr:hypothetical protein DF040_14330 [Burkholderia cenocepacia]
MKLARFFIGAHDAAPPGRFAPRRHGNRSSGARSAPAWRIVQFTQIFFRRPCTPARKRRTIRPCRAARRAPIRPHHPAPLHQGNPGIFSHFLRNNG